MAITQSPGPVIPHDCKRDPIAARCCRFSCESVAKTIGGPPPEPPPVVLMNVPRRYPFRGSWSTVSRAISLYLERSGPADRGRRSRRLTALLYKSMGQKITSVAPPTLCAVQAKWAHLHDSVGTEYQNRKGGRWRQPRYRLGQSHLSFSE